MKIRKRISTQFFIVALMLSILFSTFGVVSYAAGDAKPDVEGLGEEVNATYIGGYSHTGSGTGTGLFDGTTPDEYMGAKIMYWYDSQAYVEVDIPENCNIWRSGTTTWADDTGLLKIEKWNGTTYDDVTSNYSQQVTSITNLQWEKTIENLPAGRYKFSKGGSYRIDSEWYIEKVSSAQQDLSLDIEAPSYEIPGGTEFETFAVIKEASNIYAEDINIEYDKSLFELVSAEPVDSGDLKIYHEETSTDGEARYVVASKGDENGLDGDEQILKITFKAKNVDGSGDIEVVSGLVADGEGNEITPSFGGKTFTITKRNLGDVNKDGNFTLGDLAIAGRLFASNSDDWESYEPDVDANGDVEDIDLSSIVQSIIDNE